MFLQNLPKRILFPCLVLICLLVTFISGCGGNSGGHDRGNPPSPFSIAESLVPATGSTVFPIYSDDSAVCNTVTHPYYMAKYDVTYQLWSEVYTWATDSVRGTAKYNFANQGSRGGGTDGTQWVVFNSGHESDPVTKINWRDAIIWCNALTEYYNARNQSNLVCVYRDNGGQVIRDATQTSVCDGLTDFDHTADGFRLPTSMEWELAARYKGNDSSNGAISMGGLYWTPGNYASGATAKVGDGPPSPTTWIPNPDMSPTQAVAWYWDNCNVPDPNIHSTQPVGRKNPNALGIYDMSGNVSQWCFDQITNQRKNRGGNWSMGAPDETFMVCALWVGLDGSSLPDSTWPNIGFRTVRSQ
jgi:sulfatase modifying factor 1